MEMGRGSRKTKRGEEGERSRGEGGGIEKIKNMYQLTIMNLFIMYHKHMLIKNKEKMKEERFITVEYGVQLMESTSHSVLEKSRDKT